jgi:hypothetical protein
MRKLVLQMQISVDGCVSAADGDLAWQVWDWSERWPVDADSAGRSQKPLEPSIG